MERGPTLFNLKELERTPLELIKKCQKWGLLPHEGAYMCPKCGNPLQLGVSSRAPDGYIWACYRRFKVSRITKKCNVKISLRTKTFFEQSKLSLIQILGFASMWMHSCPLAYAEFELSIAHKTAVDWASFCREVAFITMIKRQEAIGGEGKVVEIDESKFVKWKFHRDGIPNKSWVFGGFERGSGKIFMVPVEDRSQETLIALINKWILPGTTIMSDCWEAYNSLEQEGYRHFNVNPSVKFVDPTTGAHTKSIELAWNQAKMRISPQSRRSESLDGNLAKFMLSKKAEADGIDPVLLFYTMAGRLYNPLAVETPETRRPGEPGEEDSEEEH